MTSPKIKVEFHGGYVRLENLYQPVSPKSFFTLDNVTIGKGFHWQRSEKQSFLGSLEFIRHGNIYTAVNILPLETYLESVISSEMAATSHPQLLMAHAIISRTWALTKIRNKKREDSVNHCTTNPIADENEIIRWYGTDAHSDFDVCADDHCQRYQGIGRVSRDEVRMAVKQTRGKVLMYDGKLCDARYSKCCGGAFEEFRACWEDEKYAYLHPGRDILPEQMLPDLTVESNARKWIMSRPDSFCANVRDDTLEQNLNTYDREHFASPGNDFYRWKISYRPGELEKIIEKKSGIHIGKITDIIPIRRGRSGRIILLGINGSNRRFTVGKELEIRKWLSGSHLPSSAFVAEHNDGCGWTLYGAGWGHGVGLCQTGAAEMARFGYNYRQILQHYYPGATIEKIT